MGVVLLVASAFAALLAAALLVRSGDPPVVAQAFPTMPATGTPFGKATLPPGWTVPSTPTPGPDPRTLDPIQLSDLIHANAGKQAPLPGEASAFIRGEVRQLLFFLESQTGRPCRACVVMPPEEAVEMAALKCISLNLEGNRNHPHFEPRDAPVFDLAERACAVLDVAYRTAAPDPTALHQALVEARDLLSTRARELLGVEPLFPQ